jgi:hypothetical protein
VGTSTVQPAAHTRPRSSCWCANTRLTREIIPFSLCTVPFSKSSLNSLANCFPSFCQPGSDCPCLQLTDATNQPTQLLPWAISHQCRMAALSAPHVDNPIPGTVPYQPITSAVPTPCHQQCRTNCDPMPVSSQLSPSTPHRRVPNLSKAFCRIIKIIKLPLKPYIASIPAT